VGKHLGLAQLPQRPSKLGRLTNTGGRSHVRPWVPVLEYSVAVRVYRQGYSALFDDPLQQEEIALGVLNPIRYSL